MKKLTYTFLILLLSLLTIIPVAAQDDALAPVNTLLDQAESALDDGNLITAQALITGANALISADMVAECAMLTAAKSLLEQAASAGTVVRLRSLLIGARTLIDECANEASTSTDDETLGREPITSNADLTPVERDFDGITMVLVPAGCFMMGSTDEQITYARSLALGAGDWAMDEQPVHEQCFDEPFWIDKYPVTNEQYGGASTNSMCIQYSSEPDQPRNCVNWFNARDFCEARGGRLPTEAEWEYSARGPDGLIYPWGDEFIADNVVYSANSGGRTVDVGSRHGGASWVGTLDMAGNVWEWTSSLSEPYPYDADDGRENASSSSAGVLRGGSFNFTTFFLRAAVRFRDNPGVGDLDFGFRCARSS